MLALLLATASAVAYGVSDFIGGLKSRSVSVLWVVAVAQLTTSVCVMTWALLFRPGTPTLSAVLLGALAGVASVYGQIQLMRGFARGAMHVAGPLSAVLGAAVPVAIAIMLGERPSGLAWLGIALALPAVWLVAAGGEGTADVAGGPGAPAASGRRRRLGAGVAAAGAKEGLLAGLGFAVYFTAVGRAEPGVGGWQVVFMQIAEALVVAGLLLWRRTRPRFDVLAFPMVQGVLAGVGTVTFFLAAQTGLLSIVAVTASLYPAWTVLLAVLFVGERPTRTQLAGLACSAVTVVLIALGSG